MKNLEIGDTVFVSFPMTVTRVMPYTRQVRGEVLLAPGETVEVFVPAETCEKTESRINVSDFKAV